MIGFLAFLTVTSIPHQPNLSLKTALPYASITSGVKMFTSPMAACCGNMAQFVSDPKFIAAHFAPSPIAFKAESGTSVAFKALGEGGEAHGFLVPPSKGNHVTIIMVHEYWGLNDYIRKTAEKLHSDTGYGVLAVDLYDGKVTTNPQEAGKLMSEVSSPRCASILGGAFLALDSGKFGFKPKKIGTVGYCFGGGWSEKAAIIGSQRVQACVIYYGMPDMRPESLKRLKAPILMFEGLQDGWITPTVVGNFAAALKTAHRSFALVKYEAPHAFANPSNPKYNPAAASDSYKRELSFFKSHLG